MVVGFGLNKRAGRGALRSLKRRARFCRGLVAQRGMPNYAGSEWAGRAIRRKGVRDDARARFEALAGMQPVRQQDENAHAPQEQLLKVVRLLQVTRDAGVTGDQKAALVDMARALAATGLGKGPMAMARIKADADFLAGEIALDIAMGVVTGGAAVGIKLVAKRLAGEVTEIAIRVASKVAANVPDANLVRNLKVPDRAIDPKILNEILDEDKLGTGSKSADVSARGEVPDPAKEKPDGSAAAADAAAYRHPREGQPPRSQDELAPGGNIPSGEAFKSWWNDLSYDELRSLSQNKPLWKKIEDRIRNGGKMHEWLKVSQQLEHKRLGFSMEEIQQWVTATREANGPLPQPTAKGEIRWRHSPESGRGSGPGSQTMHNALGSGPINRLEAGLPA